MMPQRKPGGARKPLPPYGREILEMLRLKLRPAILGGSIVAALDWNLGTAWPRIVLPRDHDPHGYELGFLAGLDVLVVYRPNHPREHVAAALDAIRGVQPHVCAPMALPHLAGVE